MIQAEELPVKPNKEDYGYIKPKLNMRFFNDDVRKYESEIAALKAKAILVGNPDIIAEVINRSSTHGGTVFTLVNGVANVFTEWPGDVEIKDGVAILTLPKEPQQ